MITRSPEVISTCLWVLNAIRYRGGHILSLRTSGNNDHLIFGQALDGGQIHNAAGLHLQIAQLCGNLQHIFQHAI